jgi:hypothetical protein
MEKKRFKMYKKGKLWLVAPIIFVGLLGGAAFSSKETIVFADEITVEDKQPVQNSGIEPKAESHPSDTIVNEPKLPTVQEDESTRPDTNETDTNSSSENKDSSDVPPIIDETTTGDNEKTPSEPSTDTKPDESKDEESKENSQTKEPEENRNEDEDLNPESDNSKKQETTNSTNKNQEENKEVVIPPSNNSSKIPETNKSTVKVAAPQSTKVQTKAATPVSIPIYRVYNPNSGEHLHTMNSFERDYLVRLGWRNEGISMRVSNSGKQLFRIYNPNSGEHFYTLNAKERDNLKKYGWRYEGIAWLTPVTGLPMYRVYNPNTRGAGAHHYMMLQSERDFLVRSGWRSEGISWYTLGLASPIDLNFLGINRQYIVNELSKHQNDKYYLGTPYKGLAVNNAGQYMKPGSSMNCTGFVAKVIQNAGGNISKITNLSNNWGGAANAYNWRNALNSSVTSYQYKSVADMLKSGKAKKGDIIYFEPNYSVTNYDCHIGFFWGNNSNENKMWHSVPAVNKISSIYAPAGYSKVIIYSM